MADPTNSDTEAAARVRAKIEERRDTDGSKRIAELESQIRRSEHYGQDRQAQLVRATARIQELEGRVRALTNSVTDAAFTAEAACARLLRYEPVIVAARTFVEDPASVNALFALDAAITELDKKAAS